MSKKPPSIHRVGACLLTMVIISHIRGHGFTGQVLLSALRQNEKPGSTVIIIQCKPVLIGHLGFVKFSKPPSGQYTYHGKAGEQ